jgi:hypothetical protein
LIALLAPDRRENAFSRLPFVYLLFEVLEFLKRDLLEPIHYPFSHVYR